MNKDTGQRTYKIHSGNELSLMLSGKKPMAVFYRYVTDDFDETGGQNFRTHVKSGKIKRSYFYVNDQALNKKIIYYTYTLEGEEWRSEMYKFLKKNIDFSWSEDMEIIEGTLLGYSIENNMEHIHFRRNGNNF